MGRLLACLVVLLWPALLNGQYFVFFDTAGYIRGAARAFDLLLGIESEWSALYDPAAGSHASSAADASTDDSVMAGRSIYYGLMIYVGELFGSMWLALILQSLAVALCIYIVFQAFGQKEHATRSILFIALATPASFFASYLMPDVFTGITILAVVSLILLWERLRPWMRMAVAGLLLASLLFHTSHIALAAALAVPVTIASLLWRRPFQVRGAAIVAVAVLLAVGAEVAFYRAVEAVYGQPPTRPPFLMARVVADGPGTEYLRATCPDSGFRLCDYLDVLPMDADRFLWSGQGVYARADLETRKLLSDEQTAFALASLNYDPVGQAAASLSNAVEQLGRFGIGEFEYPESLRRMMSSNMPPAAFQEFRDTLLYKRAFPLRQIDFLFKAVVVGAAVYLLFSAFRESRGGSIERPSSHRRATGAAARRADGRLLLLFVGVVLLGVLLNAAITGTLSGPHDRYQARVVWLVPMLALLVHAWRQPGASAMFRQGR